MCLHKDDMQYAGVTWPMSTEISTMQGTLMQIENSWYSGTFNRIKPKILPVLPITVNHNATSIHGNCFFHLVLFRDKHMPSRTDRDQQLYHLCMELITNAH